MSAVDYRGASFAAATQIYPPRKINTPADPFSSDEPRDSAVSAPAVLYQFRNIEFWGRYGGSIVTSDHRLLADLSPEVWGVENHPLFSELRLPPLKHLAGQTAIAVTPEAPGNYYHWLVDLLPRVALIQLSGRQFDRLLINGSGADYERDSLNAMKIAREKIVYVDGRDRFEIEQAIVPSMDHTSQTVAPWKVEVLRKLDDTIPANPNTPRRIYVSRRHAAVRRVINETEFEEALKAANFAIVELESMAWQRQVSLFRAAEVILAPHGAALANIAFAQLGTRVAEIGTRAGYKDFYLQLAAAAGLEYQLIEAQPRTASRRESLRPSENEDMAVEIATIRQFLKSL